MPDWVPLGKDATIRASGVVEIGVGDGLGLDTDRKRGIRLAFKPLMVAAAWWSTRNTDTR